eukprot:TRINITY_DN8704_c0_g4_i1.p1 TRINITY_DN8704_c0_g4~~TRINITY_DN8704_c0_g4_i1.p1  ORF type:complete len:109 (+),score=21.23 TRINITY_DN8704_c0_g4_i1:65-391(+)
MCIRDRYMGKIAGLERRQEEHKTLAEDHLLLKESDQGRLKNPSPEKKLKESLEALNTKKINENPQYFLSDKDNYYHTRNCRKVTDKFTNYTLEDVKEAGLDKCPECWH